MDVGFRLLSLGDRAYAIYERYKARDDERKCLARFMLHLARTLRVIRSVPQHAGPIVSELDALVARAEEKVAKYDERGRLPALLLMYFEERKLKSIMDEAQHLLPLLTVSIASAADVSAAVARLQRRADSLRCASADAAQHLCRVAGAVERLAQRSVSAIEVQQSMTTLRESMLLLHDGSMQTVLEGCSELHVRVATDMDQTRSVGDMRRTAEAFGRVVEGKLGEMLAQQGDVLAKQDELGTCMRQMKGQLDYLSRFCVLPADCERALQSGRNLSALHVLNQEADLCAPQDTQDPPSRAWATAVKNAISRGRLKVTSCLVLGVPLMPEGPLRPVTLPCCGFVVSQLGAQQLLQQRRCHLCHVPLAADSHVQPNDAVALAVAAEERGLSPRLLTSADVAVGEKIGAGSQGIVHRGRWGDVEVAVKRIPLQPAAGAQEMACVRHVVAASHLAAVASPHVCKLHGYCWTDSELWLVLELCDGTLSELVRRIKDVSRQPGLPPLDVVTLGLMLCCALDAVHRGARYLHLDVKPSNILVKISSPSAGKSLNGGCAASGASCAGKHASERTRRSHAVHAVSVRLSDFGLAHHLPTCIGSSMLSSAGAPQQQHIAAGGGSSGAVAGAVSGGGLHVGKGTPGFAPPEQLGGQPRRRSDVYGLGATLLFALTGRCPYGRASAHAISFHLASGIPMDVPDYIQPPQLHALLRTMTSLTPSDRPPLAVVQEQLQTIHTSLTSTACAADSPGPCPQPHFLTPVHGMRKPPPRSLSLHADLNLCSRHREPRPKTSEGVTAISGASDPESSDAADEGHTATSTFEMHLEERAASAPASMTVCASPTPAAAQRPEDPGVGALSISAPGPGAADIFLQLSSAAQPPAAPLQLSPSSAAEQKLRTAPHAYGGAALRGGRHQDAAAADSGELSDELMPEWEISADESGTVKSAVRAVHSQRGSAGQHTPRNSGKVKLPMLTSTSPASTKQLPPQQPPPHSALSTRTRSAWPQLGGPCGHGTVHAVGDIGAENGQRSTALCADSTDEIRQVMHSSLQHHRMHDGSIMHRALQEQGSVAVGGRPVVNGARSSAHHTYQPPDACLSGSVISVSYEMSPSSAASQNAHDGDPARSTAHPPAPVHASPTAAAARQTTTAAAARQTTTAARQTTTAAAARQTTTAAVAPHRAKAQPSPHACGGSADPCEEDGQEASNRRSGSRQRTPRKAEPRAAPAGLPALPSTPRRPSKPRHSYKHAKGTSGSASSPTHISQPASPNSGTSGAPAATAGTAQHAFALNTAQMNWATVDWTTVWPPAPQVETSAHGSKTNASNGVPASTPSTPPRDPWQPPNDTQQGAAEQAIWTPPGCMHDSMHRGCAAIPDRGNRYQPPEATSMHAPVTQLSTGGRGSDMMLPALPVNAVSGHSQQVAACSITLRDLISIAYPAADCCADAEATQNSSSPAAEPLLSTQHAPRELTSSLLCPHEPALLPGLHAWEDAKSQVPPMPAGEGGRGLPTPLARCARWLRGLRTCKRSARKQWQHPYGRYQGLAGGRQDETPGGR
eukprot:jgi/Ulvmu1/6891/UM031_0097.1